MKAFLNPEDPNTNNLQYYEITNEKNLLTILQFLDISPKKIGYNEESGFFNTTELIRIYHYLRKSNKTLVQINAIDTNNIQISPIIGKNPEVLQIYILLTTQNGSGFLIKDKLAPISYNELPEIIKNSR